MISSDHIFAEIAIIMMIATVLGAGAVRLRQPLIIAFIAVGILVGPAGLSLLTAHESVNLLAELGITLLLFVVGLKLDLHEIRTVGKVALIAGMGQILLIGGLGFGVAILLGFTPLTAAYLGITFTFSSTIIIVKLLSDKREIDALHGRIAVGILIIQDILVVLVMIGLTAFAEASQPYLFLTIFGVIVKGSSFLVIISVITRYLLPKILDLLAQSTELLLLFAITWAFSLASVGNALGFSKEVGAFVAGVTLASTAYRATIGAKLVSVRDFLLLFFFINLGIHVNIHYLTAEIVPALLFSAFILIGKPIMLMILLARMGYSRYTSVITSLSLGQISEFSLILATLGVSLGHISPSILGLITLVGLITMGASTYLILYSHPLYERLTPYLTFFDYLITSPNRSLKEASLMDFSHVDVILFGLGRYGGNLMQHFQQMGWHVLGVDFDPELVSFWQKKGMLAFYGDAENPDFMATLPLQHVRWIVSTLPNKRMGLMLLHTLKNHCFKGNIALTSHNFAEKEILCQEGADLVLLPFEDAAQEAARQIVLS